MNIEEKLQQEFINAKFKSAYYMKEQCAKKLKNNIN